MTRDGERKGEPTLFDPPRHRRADARVLDLLAFAAEAGLELGAVLPEVVPQPGEPAPRPGAERARGTLRQRRDRREMSAERLPIRFVTARNAVGVMHGAKYGDGLGRRK